jgi:hypothetical protein
MKTIEHLTVNITYKVGYGKVEMPEIVHEQLIQASENGDEIEMGRSSEYEEAYEWLSNNILERDCMEWKAEIEEVSENGN